MSKRTADSTAVLPSAKRQKSTDERLALISIVLHGAARISTSLATLIWEYTHTPVLCGRLVRTFEVGPFNAMDVSSALDLVVTIHSGSAELGLSFFRLSDGKRVERHKLPYEPQGVCFLPNSDVLTLAPDDKDDSGRSRNFVQYTNVPQSCKMLRSTSVNNDGVRLEGLTCQHKTGRIASRDNHIRRFDGVEGKYRNALIYDAGLQTTVKLPIDMVLTISTDEYTGDWVVRDDANIVHWVNDSNTVYRTCQLSKDTNWDFLVWFMAANHSRVYLMHRPPECRVHRYDADDQTTKHDCVIQLPLPESDDWLPGPMIMRNDRLYMSMGSHVYIIE